MKLYEVFVCVPYLDPDWNECYNRHNGKFFANKSDAKEYMDKMLNDKNANYDMNPELDHKEPMHRYVYESDYKEVDFGWNDIYHWSLLEEKSETELDGLEAILATNSLVDDMKYYDAILLGVTYGGNRWYLREAELD